MAGTNTFKLFYNRHIDYVPLNRLRGHHRQPRPDEHIPWRTLAQERCYQRLEFPMVYRYRSGRHRLPLSERLVLSTDIRQNAIVNGYSYDPATGVRTYQAYNTSGNWNGTALTLLLQDIPTDRPVHTQLNHSGHISQSRRHGRLRRSETLRTAVKTPYSDRLSDLAQIGKHELRVNGNVNWRDTRGTRTGFNNFSATNTTATLAGKIVLPYNFELSSDFNVYTRRGYSDPSLNTTDLVWNARLAYSTNGGRWTFMLDGFDLLNQLSNVSYNVNAQGRTETYTNVLPRYALLHVQYRFMIQPKKR